jgi:hypothetical protein
VGLVVNQLRELQKVERALRQCLNNKEEHNRAVRMREIQIEKQEAELEELQATRKRNQIASDEKDLELKTKQAEIDRLQSQLVSIRTNREFAAMQNEIKFAQIAISRIEDEILSDLAEIEECETRIEDVRGRIGNERQALQGTIETASRAKEQLDAEAKDLEAQLAEVEKTLPSEAVQLFKRIAGRYDGEAMATVIKSGSEVICRGCSMRVPRNIYLLLHGESDRLITCQSCSRILNLED